MLRSKERKYVRSPGSRNTGYVNSIADALKSFFSLRFIRLLLGLIGMVAFFVLAYTFFEDRREELEQIVFSTERQSGFLESDLSSDFDGESPFTLLLVVQEAPNEKAVADGFVLISLDPTSGTADVISVHSSLFVALQRIPELPFVKTDLSAARIRDLMIIGDLQNPPVPLAYFVYQLEEQMALSVDGYLVFPPELRETFGDLSAKDDPVTAVADVESVGYEEWSREWGTYWADFLSSISLLHVWADRESVSKIESNMNILEVYEFSKELSRIPADGVQILTVSDEDVEEVVDDRGNVVNSIGLNAIDAALSSLSPDEEMSREQARIEILNGTSINGLGGRYDRWIRHLGGDVIRVKNAPSTLDESVIYVTDTEKYAYTIERISSLWEEVKVQEGRPDFVTTGDVIIVLGMDF